MGIIEIIFIIKFVHFARAMVKDWKNHLHLWATVIKSYYISTGDCVHKDKKKKGVVYIMWEEFKAFAFKGNVLDMAVGVIVGGAFGKIVTSVVNDVIMPLFGYFTAGADFKTLKWVLSPAILDGETIIKAESAILYGNFIQNVVDFLIIALSIFLFVRMVNSAKDKVKKKPVEVVEAPVEPEAPKGPSTEELLVEIRDLLQK